MNQIIVYYEGNKIPSMEERIKETAARYQAKVLGDFAYENQVFQVLMIFNNQGQINNFKNDLIIIGNPYSVKIHLGGIV